MSDLMGNFYTNACLNIIELKTSGGIFEIFVYRKSHIAFGFQPITAFPKQFNILKQCTNSSEMKSIGGTTHDQNLYIFLLLVVGCEFFFQ